DDRAERVVPDRVVRRAVGGRPERDRADRRRRMEVLRLAPGARERDPRWMVDVDHAHVRVDSSGLRRSGDVSLAGVVDRRWTPEGGEVGRGRGWVEGGVGAMRPGGELVRWRPRRDVVDRVCSEPGSQTPGTPLTEAVLAVTDVLRCLVLGENDVDDLPVALV